MSQTLDQYAPYFQQAGITLDTPCAKCVNGIWQSFRGDPEEYTHSTPIYREDLLEYLPFRLTKQKRSFACFCGFTHAYVSTPRKTCDGFLDSEEPVIT